MKRYVVALLAALVVVGTSHAQEILIDIPKTQRVYNKTGVQCAWCCLEMAGNYIADPGTKGLTKNYKEEATVNVIVAVLSMREVKAEYTRATPLKDIRYIDAKLMEGYPVVATMYGSHMVVIVGRDDKTFRYIDPDGPDLEIRSISRSNYIRTWDGVAFVVLMR